MPRHTLAAVRMHTGPLRKEAMNAYSSKAIVHEMGGAIHDYVNVAPDAAVHLAKHYLQNAAADTPIHASINEMRDVFGAPEGGAIPFDDMFGGAFWGDLWSNVKKGAHGLYKQGLAKFAPDGVGAKLLELGQKGLEKAAEKGQSMLSAKLAKLRLEAAARKAAEAERLAAEEAAAKAAEHEDDAEAAEIAALEAEAAAAAKGGRVPRRGGARLPKSLAELIAAQRRR